MDLLCWTVSCGVVVGDGGVVLRTENAGFEEFVGFKVIDFNDFGPIRRLLEGEIDGWTCSDCIKS